MTFREDLKLAKDKEEKRLIVPAHLQSQEMFTEQLYRGEKRGLRDLYQHVQNVSLYLGLSVSKAQDPLTPHLHMRIELEQELCLL